MGEEKRIIKILDESGEGERWMRRLQERREGGMEGREKSEEGGRGETEDE